MKKNILLLLSITLMLTGCKKTKSSKKEDNWYISGMIKSISTNGTPVIEFSYDNNARIKTKTIHQGTSEIIVEYNYNNYYNTPSSETARQNGSIVWQNSYEYAVYFQQRVIQMNIGGVNNVYWKMHYDRKGNLNEAIQYVSGSEVKKQIYTYDKYHNNIETTLFIRSGNTWELQKRNEFKYDNMRNPIYEIHLPFSEVASEFNRMVSPNIILREKEYDQNNVLITDSQYQIIYNLDNFPIKMIDINTQESFEFAYY